MAQPSLFSGKAIKIGGKPVAAEGLGLHVKW